MGVLPGQRGRILHKPARSILIQVKKQIQAKPMPEYKLWIASTLLATSQEYKRGIRLGIYKINDRRGFNN